jgi:hypothetical protein
MPLVEFEPIAPAGEWAKAVDALNRAATVIGLKLIMPLCKTLIFLLLLCVFRYSIPFFVPETSTYFTSSIAQVISF